MARFAQFTQGGPVWATGRGASHACWRSPNAADCLGPARMMFQHAREWRNWLFPPARSPMARTPKASPVPALARRGRKPKEAEPIGFAADTNDGVEETEAVEAEAAIVTPVAKPARGRPGPKPKARPEPAMTGLSDAKEPQPALDLGQGEAMADADHGGTPASGDAAMDDAMPASSQGGSEQARPAARWDRAADTVQFDWPAIERTAAQDGPNQAMAKLLVAARAEGAHSRWPL